MSRSQSSTDDEELLKRLVARYVRESRDSNTSATVETQVVFWSSMREVLSVNEASMGLNQLDGLAEALIDQTGVASEVLRCLVLILPQPASQKASNRASAHSRFTAAAVKNALPAKTDSISSLHFEKSSSAKPENVSPAKLKGISSSETAAATTEPQLIKVRKERPPQKTSPASPSELKDSSLTEELAHSTPQQIRDDLETLFNEVAASNRPACQLAYDWEGSKLWYDPEAYPYVYLAHWRWWNHDRQAFRDWQFH
ncbi:hypothetical protein P3T76_001091 [Phytophthora citrophthora]|uniref:Uncharacterized protein n=1 Tax=Phytophthora citrophthora TaxID=4793 RepID=A0AAD9GYT8_9STRA|nr:hypothetical protein P3T76_001091 [Phytophthora citrophthora]